MTKYHLIGMLALAAVVIALPLYSLSEQNRMEAASDALQKEYVNKGAVIYLESCAECHGLEGEGLGANPSLNKMGISDADHELLFNTISRAAHGSSMAAWHVSEGGVFNDYQIEQLVTLIKYGNWQEVGQKAISMDIEVSELLSREITDIAFDVENSEDPHLCLACHEEPEVHLESFGLDCVRCHSLEAWAPAQLTRHTFKLNHGGDGEVACETCHVDTYVDHTCYECHDHTPEDMEAVHIEENIQDYAECISCHPTGGPDEAMQFMENVISVEG